VSAPAVRWGVWCVKRGRWLTYDFAHGVAVVWCSSTEREAERMAKQLDAGGSGDGPKPAYVAARMASL
jgi:hypothetical protein